MKKKQKKTGRTSPEAKPANSGNSLADLLNSEVADKLKQIKKEKEEEVRKEREEELARKQFEARQREKNKSFEELLKESNMDWKKFK